MSSMIDALKVRKALGVKEWLPPEPYGNGFCFGAADFSRTIIATVVRVDGGEWVHASMGYADDTITPTTEDMAVMYRAIFGDGFAYQVFAPDDDETVLSLWGRVNGEPAFGGAA